jgi:hypothetical protein
VRPPQLELSENPTVPVSNLVKSKTCSLPCSVPACSGIMTSCLPGFTNVNAMSAQADVSPETHGLTCSVPVCSGIMTSSLPAVPQTVIKVSDIGVNLDADSVPTSLGIMTAHPPTQPSLVVTSSTPHGTSSSSTQNSCGSAGDWEFETLVQAAQPSPAQSGPATPLLKPTSLKNCYFNFRHHGSEKFFIDKKLPSSSHEFIQDERFDADYFSALSAITSSEGPAWRAGTPNYRGARIGLAHTNLKIDRWRHRLLGYEGREICQFLEYGFPLGDLNTHTIWGPILAANSVD